jgi:hypothetical protein
LRREIKSLRETKAKAEKTGGKANPKTVDRTTTDSEGNVQVLLLRCRLTKTIRIQLENAKDRKTKPGKTTKHRRIKQVVVESDDSTDEMSDSATSTSDSETSEDEEFITKVKKVPPSSCPTNSEHAHSSLAPPSGTRQTSRRVRNRRHYLRTRKT